MKVNWRQLFPGLTVWKKRVKAMNGQSQGLLELDRKSAMLPRAKPESLRRAGSGQKKN